MQRLMIEICDNEDNDGSCVEQNPAISPVTMVSTTTTATEDSIATSEDSSSRKSKNSKTTGFRKMAKQASVTRLQAKMEKGV